MARYCFASIEYYPCVRSLKKTISLIFLILPWFSLCKNNYFCKFKDWWFYSVELHVQKSSVQRHKQRNGHNVLRGKYFAHFCVWSIRCFNFSKKNLCLGIVQSGSQCFGNRGSLLDRALYSSDNFGDEAVIFYKNQIFWC